jgi:predicted Zn-dependent peptidase
MNYNRSLLQNGLRVLTVPMSSFESATVLVLVGAGSRYETKQNNGISHFLEHMAFKGTEKRPSAIEIAGIIDGIGGEFNAFTGKEYTGYYIKSSNQHLALLLDVLSDMLLHSKLDPAEIEKEKGVILEELNLYEDTPSRKLGDIYEQLLYGDAPMGWDIGGDKEVIKKIQRTDFIQYMGSLYSAANISVIVAGGIAEEKTKGLVDKYFGNMKRFDTLGFEKVVDTQSKPKVFLKQKDTEQSHMALGVRTIPLEHTDRYPLEVLSAILGAGMSSRLFHEIRERRGLAYYVRTTADNYVDCGSLVTMAGVDPKRIDEAVEVTLVEYKKIADGKADIKPEELKKAKELLKGHMILELEDSRSVASFYGQQELLEKEINNPIDVMAKIDAVTIDDIYRVGKTYIVNDTLNLAVIGNFDSSERFEKLLKF